MTLSRCFVRVVVALPVLFVFGSLELPAADSEREVVRKIDQLLAESWRKAELKPAPLASDSVFLRRVYLDLTGTIPTVSQVREFLRDQHPEKRARLIDRLLGLPAKTNSSTRTGNPRHAAHLARVWRTVLLPNINNNLRLRGQANFFEQWLRANFADNTPYNQMVHELLTTTGRTTGTGPGLYYQSLELKPEKLAASVSQVFLGVQIQCAQCHDHPFDHWKQKDFWEFAAFFAQLQRPQGRNRFVGRVVDLAKGEVTLPDSKTVVSPRFLGGSPVSSKNGQTRRQQLARWLTAADNPYFARATVNRVWGMLFGYGLVDPVDDFAKRNPPSHPEILDLLARDFARNNFNLRRLFRILTRTNAYQLSSEVVASRNTEPHLFQRMAVKTLTAEQIYDCLKIATCTLDAPATQSRFPQNNLARQTFLAKFEAPTQSPTEFQSGIPQALTMMNGQLLASMTDVNQSDILQAVSESPFFSDEDRVEILFLATLARRPTSSERSQFLDYVKTGGPAKDSRKALSDVLWALLNSTEFILNH